MCYVGIAGQYRLGRRLSGSGKFPLVSHDGLVPCNEATESSTEAEPHDSDTKTKQGGASNPLRPVRRTLAAVIR